MAEQSFFSISLLIKTHWPEASHLGARPAQAPDPDLRQCWRFQQQLTACQCGEVWTGAVPLLREFFSQSIGALQVTLPCLLFSHDDRHRKTHVQYICERPVWMKNFG